MDMEDMGYGAEPMGDDEDEAVAENTDENATTEDMTAEISRLRAQVIRLEAMNRAFDTRNHLAATIPALRPTITQAGVVDIDELRGSDESSPAFVLANNDGTVALATTDFYLVPGCEEITLDDAVTRLKEHVAECSRRQG